MAPDVRVGALRTPEQRDSIRLVVSCTPSPRNTGNTIWTQFLNCPR